MKSKFKRISKRTLAFVLCVLMMFSTLFIGSITTAYATNIGNIGSVYFTGNMSNNNWDDGKSSDWQYSRVSSSDSNHYKGTFYVPSSSSNLLFRTYVKGPSNDPWTGSFASGFWFNSATTTASNRSMTTDGSNDQIVCISSSSGYIKLDCEFYGTYSDNSYLKVVQSAVASLSASLSVGSTSLKSGATTTVSGSATGGSGSYKHKYTVTDSTGKDVTSSVLNGTTFTAPSVTSRTTYTVKDTVTDSNTLLSGLAASTASKTITVEPKNIPTEPVNPDVSKPEYIYKVGELNVTLSSDEQGTPLAEQKVDEGDKVYFNVDVASVTRQYGEKGEATTYNGEVICRLYKKGRGDTPDTLVNSTMSENTEDGVSFTIFDVFDDTATYYVRVYPSADSSAYKNSTDFEVTNATVHGTFDLTVYVDLGNVDVNKYGGDVMISVMDSNGDIKIRQLSEVGNNIYSYNVDAAYYRTSENKYFADFVLRRLLLGDYTSDAESAYDNATSIAFADVDQPDLGKCYSTHAIWYKLADDNVESNFTIEGYKVDESKNTSVKRSEVHSVSGEFESDYNRFYITNNLELNNIKVYYTSDGTTYSEGSKFTYASTNEINDGQDYYYFDLPINAKKFYMVIYSDSSYKTISQRTEVVTISDKYAYNTDNAFYFYTKEGTNDPEFSKNGYYQLKMWPDSFPAVPELTNYTSDLYMCVGDTYNMVTSFHGETIQYESLNSSIASVSSPSYTGTADKKATSTVTANGTGTFSFTITPIDSVKSKGEIGTVNVHVVDKKELGVLLGNVEALESNSWKSTSGYDYVDSLVNNVSNIYDYAVQLYQSSYTQSLINSVAAELKSALENLYAPHIVNDDSIVRLSYTTANITLNTDDNGSINALQDGNTGYIKGNDDGTYTIIYAADDGSYSHSDGGTFEFKLSATASPNSGYHFVEWTNGSTQIGDKADLTLNDPINASDLSDGAVIYTAKFDADVNYVDLVIKYQFKDYDSDTSGTFEYKNGYTKDSSYTTSTMQVSEDLLSEVAAAYDGDSELLSIVKKNAPVIVSSYYDYALDENNPIDNVDLQLDGSYVVTANMTETVKGYSVTVNNNKCEDYYHFQEVVTISAADYGFEEGQDVYWYNANSEDGSTKPISTNFNYQFRVTEDMELRVAENDAGYTVDGTSVVTAAHAEIMYQNDKKKIGQNFYIENFFDVDDPKAYDESGELIEGAENVTFLGAGVFYFAWNDDTNKASKSQITSSVLENLDTYALTFKDSKTAQGSSLSYEGKNVGLSYSYINYSEDQQKEYKDQILRYSSMNSCYNYFFEAIMDSNPSYGKYSYHVYSFYIYSYTLNGETKYGVDLSDTYAAAKIYVEQ